MNVTWKSNLTREDASSRKTKDERIIEAILMCYRLVAKVVVESLQEEPNKFLQKACIYMPALDSWHRVRCWKFSCIAILTRDSSQFFLKYSRRMPFLYRYGIVMYNRERLTKRDCALVKSTCPGIKIKTKLT